MTDEQPIGYAVCYYSTLTGELTGEIVTDEKTAHALQNAYRPLAKNGKVRIYGLKNDA